MRLLTLLSSNNEPKRACSQLHFGFLRFNGLIYMKSYRRMLKAKNDVVLTEEVRSKWWGLVLAKSYCVTSQRASYVPPFPTLGEAESYFDQEAERAPQGPGRSGMHAPMPE